MDITGSDSLTESGGSSTNSSTESVNGLKFGKKVYFEDSGSGGPGKLGSSSGSGKKGKNGNGVLGNQSCRCQVEGCNVDLSDAKAYYSRHKVCGMHSKSSKVVVGGIQQRFCQQCSRFHQLPEFDQGKRSCRRRLAGHNERRRKPPSGSLLCSRFSMLSSTMFENNGRGGGFMLDFTASPPKVPGRDVWPTPGLLLSDQEPGNTSTVMGRPVAFPPSDSSWTGFSNPGLELLQGEYFTGVTTTDSTTCALSLLSNTTPWGPSSGRTSDLVVVNDLMNVVEVGPDNIHYPNASWGFNGGGGGSLRDTSSSSSPGLGLGQIPPPTPPPINQVSGGMELSKLPINQVSGGMELSELEHSRAYDSIQHINWSL